MASNAIGNEAREGLPRISMDPSARYQGPTVWTKLQILGVLTDRKIAQYQRNGKYRDNRPQLRQQHGGRLVYSV